MEDKFAIALSEKQDEDAVKEVSLKIKSVFPKQIRTLLVFFTPQYQPLSIIRTIKYTLKPENIIGVPAPALIYEDKTVEKGIIACAIQKERSELKALCIKASGDAAAIESALRHGLKEFPGDKNFMFSFIPYAVDPADFFRGVELALGKAFPVAGAGYSRSFTPRNYCIANSNVEEGLMTIFGRGLEVSFARAGGFLPLGRPRTITRAIPQEGLIMEIDRQPAANVYKYYLDDKFAMFKKNHLFSLYPLSVKIDGQRRLLHITDCLEDDSLLCVGDIKENMRVQLMFMHAQALFESLPQTVRTIKKDSEGLVFIMNSLARRKMLRELADEEIRAIKKEFGEKHKIIGVYGDYTIFPDKTSLEIAMEAGNLLMAVLR